MKRKSTSPSAPLLPYALSITVASERWLDEARIIAQRFQVPLLGAVNEADGYRLELSDAGWRLLAPPELKLGVLQLDFSQGPIAWRLRQVGRRQALGRALGLKPGQTPHVVDATAGLGRDGLVLANLGCRVTLIERSPVMALLLHDALQRTAAANLQQRVKVVHADAREWLRSLETPPDAVYLDPMYPERGKSALVKKEMRILRGLVGTDADAETLLAAALACATVRVAVKRPRGAPMIAGTAPSHRIEAPNTRYDVYMQTSAESASTQ